jgi:hypothetical protein
MTTREQWEKRANVYWARYYGQLEGCEITQYVGRDKDGFPTLLVKFPNGEQHEIQISCDPEGNGEGFLFLPYEPSMDDYDRVHKINKYEEAK